MTLPVGVLARSAFDFEGTAVPIRSLSRKEALHLRVLSDDIEQSEIYILQCGTDSTAEEVEQFRATWGPEPVDNLVDAIARLSGLLTQDDATRETRLLQEEFERQLLEGELDPFTFALAETLHMTIDDLVTRISNREYLAWRAFYVWRENERKGAVNGGG